jgi:Glycosyltransferase family 87
MSTARARNFQIYGVPLLSIVAGLTIVPSLLNTFRDVPLDFRVFMMSARALRNGLDAYRELLVLHAPSANPPAFLFAMVPLTFLSDGVAFVLWTAIGILALIFSLEKTAAALKLSATHLLIVALGLQGVAAALRFGQVTLLLLPLMTLAWLADRDDRKAAVGGWLGALIYVKPFIGVYGLYMLWRREWRTLRAMIAVYSVLTIIGLFAGIAVTLSWIETLRTITEKVSHVVNASWPALVARMFTADLSQPDPAYRPFIVAPTLAAGLSLVGVIVIALVSAWALHEKSERDTHWAILATAMLLMSPLGWMYYIPLLIPPLCATIPLLRRLGPVLVAGAILWVPSNLLARNHFGPLATATFASPYTWGLLLLWATLCADALTASAAAPGRPDKWRALSARCPPPA